MQISSKRLGLTDSPSRSIIEPENRGNLDGHLTLGKLIARTERSFRNSGVAEDGARAGNPDGLGSYPTPYAYAGSSVSRRTCLGGVPTGEIRRSPPIQACDRIGDSVTARRQQDREIRGLAGEGRAVRACRCYRTDVFCHGDAAARRPGQAPLSHRRGAGRVPRRRGSCGPAGADPVRRAPHHRLPHLRGWTSSTSCTASGRPSGAARAMPTAPCGRGAG